MPLREDSSPKWGVFVCKFQYLMSECFCRYRVGGIQIRDFIVVKLFVAIIRSFLYWTYSCEFTFADVVVVATLHPIRCQIHFFFFFSILLIVVILLSTADTLIYVFNGVQQIIINLHPKVQIFGYTKLQLMMYMVYELYIEFNIYHL